MTKIADYHSKDLPKTLKRLDLRKHLRSRDQANFKFDDNRTRQLVEYVDDHLYHNWICQRQIHELKFIYEAFRDGSIFHPPEGKDAKEKSTLSFLAHNHKFRKEMMDLARKGYEEKRKELPEADRGEYGPLLSDEEVKGLEGILSEAPKMPKQAIVLALDDQNNYVFENGHLVTKSVPFLTKSEMITHAWEHAKNEPNSEAVAFHYLGAMIGIALHHAAGGGYANQITEEQYAKLHLAQSLPAMEFVRSGAVDADKQTGPDQHVPGIHPAGATAPDPAPPPVDVKTALSGRFADWKIRWTPRRVGDAGEARVCDMINTRVHREYLKQHLKAKYTGRFDAFTKGVQVDFEEGRVAASENNPDIQRDQFMWGAIMIRESAVSRKMPEFRDAVVEGNRLVNIQVREPVELPLDPRDVCLDARERRTRKDQGQGIG